MDLKSGYPYWAIKNGLMTSFPRVEADLRCEVLVIGAGITGALIARALAAADIETVVVDERDIAWGSTAASTALLQYEIDTHLVDLARRYGEPAAVLAYRACAGAIGALRGIAGELRDVGYSDAQSLYYASHRWHRRRLERECALRKHHGFDVEWLPSAALHERFGVQAPGAILSRLAARVDPYRFTSRLLRHLDRSGVRVYDRTRVDTLRVTSRGVRADLDGGHAIRARHVVVAAGYAAQRWLHDKVASNRSTYALITDPIDPAVLGPWAHTLLWESARPYLYLRSSDDHRLLVGGADDRIDLPSRRDARVPKKAAALQQRIEDLFPALDAKPAFAWAGTFAETFDGLPFFGAHPQYGARVLFALAYGGNGITFAAIGGDLIVASIRRRRHPLAALFGFARLR